MPFCAYCGTQVDTANGLPCPLCGKPKNGAPLGPPIAKPVSSSNGPMIVIIVIVVLFFVVAIGGIMAAIAIPNLLTAMQRAKQKRAMAEVQTIAIALEAYAVDHQQHYPESQDVAGLASTLSPTYVRVVPRLDGWGHAYRYECWSSTGSGPCDRYAVGSNAKDGQAEHDSLHDYPDEKTTNFDCDIVYANGSFVQEPENHR